MSDYFEFRCNRCETTARVSGRTTVEMFTAHHMQTVHPLYTAEAIRTVWAPKPRRVRLRSASATLRIAS